MKRLGIDIGSTTVKVAVIDEQHNILFSDYERHYANIQETLASLLRKAKDQIGDVTFAPTVTGSGGLSISSYLEIPFCQEVVCVSTALRTMPQGPMSPLSWAAKMLRSFILPTALIRG